MTVTMNIAGHPFHFTTCETDDLRNVISVWEDLFATVNPVEPVNPVAIKIIAREESESPVTAAPENAELLFENEDASFWVSANGDYWMRRRGYDCHMAPDTLTMEFAPAFWEQTLFERRDAFLTTVAAQLRLRGVYGFHGNALTKAGTSILIVGDSGAGKTTLTISLVRNGWDYLSDDALGLARHGESIEARALRQGISLTADAMERWAGSDMWDDAPRPLGSNKNKGLVLPGAGLKARFTPTCVPAAVFFCQVGDSGTSEIVELPKAAALGLCLRQALGLWMDSSLTKVHVELLKDLVDQSSCYRIITGKDVLDRPENVSELIFAASRR